MNYQNEHEAIKDLNNGNKQAFGYIFDMYAPRIERYVKRLIHDSENSPDIISDTFMKAFVNIHSFNPDESFSPWIYRIAHNEAVNFMKKKKAIPFSWFDSDTLLPSILDTKEVFIDTHFDDDSIKKIIEESLNDLSVKDNEILNLFYFEDFSYEEISTILKIPKTTVGVRLNRAKQRIKQLLERKNIMNEYEKSI